MLLTKIIHSTSAISPRRGLIAYGYVAERLKRGEVINVSFEGITDCTSAFCNSFVGRLYQDFDISVIQKQLIIEGLEEGGLWQKKVNTAILLATNQGMREAHMDALKKLISL